jgi:hypothetical protein
LRIPVAFGSAGLSGNTSKRRGFWQLAWGPSTQMVALPHPFPGPKPGAEARWTTSKEVWTFLPGFDQPP